MNDGEDELLQPDIGEFGLSMKSVFMVDAMYYHAAQQSYDRALKHTGRIDRARRALHKMDVQWTELQEKRREIEAADEYSPRLAEISVKQERLAIQMESVESNVGEAYAPYLQAFAITHILCVAALESHINIGAAELLPENALPNFLNRPIRNKWLDLLKELGKAGFDRNVQPYKGFDTLINLRNKLVHYRPQEELWRSETGVPDYVSELGLTKEAAAGSLETVKAMITALAEKIGQEIPAWISGKSRNYFAFRIE